MVKSSKSDYYSPGIVNSELRIQNSLVGMLGFEPRQTESESVVLPLHNIPMFKNRQSGIGNKSRNNIESRKSNLARPKHSTQNSAFITQNSLVGLLGFEPRQTESKSVVLPLHHNPIMFPN